MMNLKKWLGKDVVLILKNGQEKTGTLKGPVIESDMIENEVRLLNGIFVTHIKSKISLKLKMPSDIPLHGDFPSIHSM